MVRVYIFARPDLSRMPAACNISACCVHASAVRTHWTSCVMKEACPTGTCVRGGSTPPGLVKNGVLRCTPSSRIYHTSCSRLQEMVLHRTFSGPIRFINVYSTLIIVASPRLPTAFQKQDSPTRLNRPRRSDLRWCKAHLPAVCVCCEHGPEERARSFIVAVSFKHSLTFPTSCMNCIVPFASALV